VNRVYEGKDKGLIVDYIGIKNNMNLALHEKLIELSREVKKIVDDKTRYTDCFKKEDIKAELHVDLILVLDQYGYPPETNDLVYKQVFEQAENFKKYCE
jgi:type I site-specific restriction-modification system R (restriction) subunit